MKRLLTLFLALALILSLAACGSGDGSTDGDGGSTVLVDELDPWSIYREHESLDAALASLESTNYTEQKLTAVSTADDAAMAALDYRFTVIAGDSLLIEDGLVGEATIARQVELIGQNPYSVGGHLVFLEGQVLPYAYIDPTNFRVMIVRSVRISREDISCYPMYHASFTTRYEEWAVAAHAELQITAAEQPELADRAEFFAIELQNLLHAFDNIAPIDGERVSVEVEGKTVSYAVPDGWEEITETRVAGNTIAIFHRASLEAGAGGMVFSIVLAEPDAEGAFYEGRDAALKLVQPTEPQYVLTTSVEYIDIQSVIPDILFTAEIE